MNRTKERREKLLKMAMGLLEGKSAIEFIRDYEEAIWSVTPQDVVYLVDEMVLSTQEMTPVKKAVSKLLNVFFEPLNRQNWHFPASSFLQYFVLENQEVDLRMKKLKKLLKKLNTKGISEDEFDFTKKGLSAVIKEIADYEKHYIRKENVLFPNIEKKMEDYHCLQVMWSIHDDFRESIRNLIRLLEEQEYNLDEINREMGHLFFAVYPIIFREEKILFPVVAELFSKQELREMHNESLELGFSFMDQDLIPESIDVKGDDPATSSLKNMTTGQIDLGTGLLQKIQLIEVLNSLPIDMTFVDENDEVRYFSNPADRIFPRSKSIIGRKVQNCHPPESMHMVEEILDSFKSGAKNIESFWINIKGKFILIQYFAVRDEQGNYLGTLEVSQDATETRSLQGEKRLIDK